MFYATTFPSLLFSIFIVSKDQFLELGVWEEEEGEGGDQHDEEGDQEGEEHVVAGPGHVELGDCGDIPGSKMCLIK